MARRNRDRRVAGRDWAEVVPAARVHYLPPPGRKRTRARAGRAVQQTSALATGETVIADEDYLRESILRPSAKMVAGYTVRMPTFQGQIGEEGLVQIIAFIKSLSWEVQIEE